MAIVDLVMPKMGESIMEATILKWHKQAGDFVKQDETLLDIATDKVDSEVPSTAEGILKETLFNENDVVPIGTVIARIETNAASNESSAQQAYTPNHEIVETPIITENKIEEEVPFVPKSTSTSNSIKANNGFYSPLVLNIANSEGVSMVEIEKITGTGNEGRVSKSDILQYIADKKAGKIIPLVSQTREETVPQITSVSTSINEVEPSASISVSTKEETISTATSTIAASAPTVTITSGNVEIIEMDRMRKLIAKHMVDSKHISPHVTSFVEADVTNMVVWRNKNKKSFEQREGSKITFTPMFVECLIKVMKKFPLINCSLDGDKIIIKKDLNIGMATALPNGNLIVPVIKGADQLNLIGLTKAVNSLADAGRNNKLKPDDTQGGTFTLTNVGTFGSLMGTPIINQPQVAILAVGAIKKRPVVIETPEGDTIGIRHMMYLSLSYDHRIVDGSIGASFLTAVAKEFEKWDVDREV